MNAFKKINGKKRYIAGGLGVVLSTPFLINFFIGWHTQSVADHVTVEVHTEQIKKLEKLPEQMTAVETNVENIKDDINKIEQSQAVMEGDIKKILGKLGG